MNWLVRDSVEWFLDAFRKYSVGTENDSLSILKSNKSKIEITHLEYPVKVSNLEHTHLTSLDFRVSFLIYEITGVSFPILRSNFKFLVTLIDTVSGNVSLYMNDYYAM